MTEQGPQSGERHFVPERARQNVIKTFKDNFDAATLSQERKDATLINLSFVPNRVPVEVSYFMGIQPTPFSYDFLDRDFIRTVEPYLKSGSTPTILNDIFTLSEFKHMPPALRRYLGTRIQATSTLYDMVDSLDGKRNVLSQTRYLYAKDERVINIAEIWRIQSMNKDETLAPSNSTKGEELPQLFREFATVS